MKSKANKYHMTKPVRVNAWSNLPIRDALRKLAEN